MTCLKKAYGTDFEFTDSVIEDAKATLSRLLSFKANVESWLISLKDNFGKKFSNHDLQLEEKSDFSQQAIETAARDNFDFPEILKIILSQVSTTEAYYQHNLDQTHPLLLYKSLNVLKHTCETILGLRLEQETSSHEHLASLEKLLKFRFNVRSLALKDGSSKEFLALCDEIRDELQMDGLFVSDGKDKSIWKFRKT